MFPLRAPVSRDCVAFCLLIQIPKAPGPRHLVFCWTTQSSDGCAAASLRCLQPSVLSFTQVGAHCSQPHKHDPSLYVPKGISQFCQCLTSRLSPKNWTALFGCEKQLKASNYPTKLPHTAAPPTAMHNETLFPYGSQSYVSQKRFHRHVDLDMEVVGIKNRSFLELLCNM